MKSERVRKGAAIEVSVERYAPGRRAEFLLSNAVDAADYRKARKEVRKLGLDPDLVPPVQPALEEDL